MKEKTKVKKPGWVEEFKTFIMRGNVMNLAVGVIIGSAFGTITTSLTDDLIMPIISLVCGGISFESWQLNLTNLLGKAGTDGADIILNFGSFVSAVLNFLILALVIFWMVKVVNGIMDKAKKKEEAPAPVPEPSNEEKLLAEIRDLLKENDGK